MSTAATATFVGEVNSTGSTFRPPTSQSASATASETRRIARLMQLAAAPARGRDALGARLIVGQIAGSRASARLPRACSMVVTRPPSAPAGLSRLGGVKLMPDVQRAIR